MRSLIIVAALFAGIANAADKMPAYKADFTQTSVSGLSSGAYMAVQYQVAFSNEVKGAGIIAGGPYYCAAGTPLFAGICMGQVPFLPPNAQLMLDAAKGFEANGKIDPLANLGNARIYVFSGTRDPVVRKPAVDSAVDFFVLAGVPKGNIRYVNNIRAGHAFIAPTFGNRCETPVDPPFVSHCTVGGKNYDQAGEILGHIYGSLKPPARTPRGRIIPFDQTEFADAGSDMAATGYAYVPERCSNGGGNASCKVHIALHGCSQSADSLGGAMSDDFYKDAGYNRWADSNNIMVLYPQVNKSFSNSYGCWDWTGYTGTDYAFKSGMQMAAIKKMVDRLGGR